MNGSSIRTHVNNTGPSIAPKIPQATAIEAASVASSSSCRANSRAIGDVADLTDSAINTFSVKENNLPKSTATKIVESDPMTIALSARFARASSTGKLR